MKNVIDLEKTSAVGTDSVTASSAVSLSVVHYYQNGQTWSSDYCGGLSSNPTIATAGCAITSFAMVERYYGGSDDPGEVNSCLGTNAYPMSWTTAAVKYGLSSPTVNTYSDETLNQAQAYSDACENIRTYSKPVIIGMKPKSGTGDSHFVVAKGVAPENAYIYINDPDSGKNYSVLSQYTSTYYVYEIIVY